MAQPDDARRAAEQYAGVHAEDLAEKRRAVLLLGHGRELPGFVEKLADKRDDLRQEVPCAEQTDPGFAAAAAVTGAHGLDVELVRGVDDQKLIEAGIIGTQ